MTVSTPGTPVEVLAADVAGSDVFGSSVVSVTCGDSCGVDAAGNVTVVAELSVEPPHAATSAPAHTTAATTGDLAKRNDMPGRYSVRPASSVIKGVNLTHWGDVAGVAFGGFAALFKVALVVAVIGVFVFRHTSDEEAKCEAIDLAERLGQVSHIDTIDKVICVIPSLVMPVGAEALCAASTDTGAFVATLARRRPPVGARWAEP